MGIRKARISIAQEKKELIKQVTTLKSTPFWFRNLMPIQGRNVLNQFNKTRIFKFKNMEVVIKQTHGQREDGHHAGVTNEHPIRKFMLEFHKQLRKIPISERKALLKTPQLIGIVGNYLIIEKVNEYVPKNREEAQIIGEGFRFISEQISKTAKSNAQAPPQTMHIWCAGIFKGKPVFYVPYDYH